MKDNIDELLKLALLPTIKPDDKLNETIFNHQNLRRKNNMSIFQKIPKAAAVAACVLCLGSVSVFAANTALKNTTAFRHGITTDSNMKVTDDGTEVTSPNVKDDEFPTFDATSMENTKEATVDDISVENGTADTPWLSKKVQSVTEYNKTSDDAINWEDYTYIVTKTTYTFADYAGAVTEAEMDNWFSKEYEALKNVTYVESLCESEELNDRTIEGTFKFGSGTFELSESKSLNNEGEAEDVDSFTLITNETSNERTYTNENGYTFNLADDESNGETRTNVVIAYKNYTGHISFYNMTEDEIYHVLDTVQIN